jgi:hypothetical protein
MCLNLHYFTQKLNETETQVFTVLEVPEDAGTVDEWTEGEASASEKAEVKQKTKLKEKKGEQKKKGAATLGKAEDRSPKGKGKAHHRESSTSGKEHSEEKKKLTITELIPNGNEHLGQLRTETKWLEKRGKSKSKSKKKQASVAAKGMSSEEEVASSLPWAEGDQRFALHSL